MPANTNLLTWAATGFLCAVASCDLLGQPETHLIRSVPSPDSSQKAILLGNDGNATVAASLQVSILDYNHKVLSTELGNVFVVDGHPLDSTSIDFRWLSSDTLFISYDQRLRTFRQEQNIYGVTIIYEPQ